MELAATEVVPSSASRMFNVQCSMFNVNDSRGIVFAEIQVECADSAGAALVIVRFGVRFAGFEAVELEVGAEGIKVSGS